MFDLLTLALNFAQLSCKQACLSPPTTWAVSFASQDIRDLMYRTLPTCFWYNTMSDLETEIIKTFLTTETQRSMVNQISASWQRCNRLLAKTGCCNKTKRWRKESRGNKMLKICHDTRRSLVDQVFSFRVNLQLTHMITTTTCFGSRHHHLSSPSKAKMNYYFSFYYLWSPLFKTISSADYDCGDRLKRGNWWVRCQIHSKELARLLFLLFDFG